jgi:hypothetical protein
MRKQPPVAVLLALALLASGCTVYKIKELDANSLAARKKNDKVLAVETKDGVVQFRGDDPAKLEGAGIVGRLYGVQSIDPGEIADLAPSGKRAKVVLRDGRRYEVLASHDSGDSLACEVAATTWIPLDVVVKARIRAVDTAASVLSTLAGVVLVAGALALDSSGDADEEYDPSDDVFFASLVDSLFEPDGPPRPRRSVKSLLGTWKLPPAAEESEFWTMEWTRIDGLPGEDGMISVGLDNRTGVPRGVDEAKLLVVDHPPGSLVAPDARGVMRAFADPLPPLAAKDGRGDDILPLVQDRDDVFWRGPVPDPSQAGTTVARDQLDIEFPRPAGARRVKLVVDASNSTWRALFARGPAAPAAAPDAKGKPAYTENEYASLPVLISTVAGWQTGQVIFATGPVPPETVLYDLELGDVAGDSVHVRLAPPAGYWLIDRLAVDYGRDGPVEETVVEASGESGPDAVAVLAALAAEDGTTAFYPDSATGSVLTFAVPPPKDEMTRTLFLRTVSCYEMPPRPALPAAPLSRGEYP